MLKNGKNALPYIYLSIEKTSNCYTFIWEHLIFIDNIWADLYPSWLYLFYKPNQSQILKFIYPHTPHRYGILTENIMKSHIRIQLGSVNIYAQ